MNETGEEMRKKKSLKGNKRRDYVLRYGEVYSYIQACQYFGVKCNFHFIS